MSERVIMSLMFGGSRRKIFYVFDAVYTNLFIRLSKYCHIVFSFGIYVLMQKSNFL